VPRAELFVVGMRRVQRFGLPQQIGRYRHLPGRTQAKRCTVDGEGGRLAQLAQPLIPHRSL